MPDMRTAVGLGVGLQYAEDFCSSESPIGLFRARTDLDSPAQDTLLVAFMCRL